MQHPDLSNSGDHPRQSFDGGPGQRRDSEEGARVDSLVLNSVEVAVVATDLTGTIISWNRFAESLYGWQAEEAIGRSVMELMECSCFDAGPGNSLLPSGQPWTGELVVRRKDGKLVPTQVRCGPIVASSGSLIGVAGMYSDVTQANLAKEAHNLLVRELHHRVKNTLASVDAIMRATARASVSLEEFQAAFARRIEALAKTHSLLAEEAAQAIVFEHLLEAELGPYRDGSGMRIRLNGPAIILPSAAVVPLGLAIHELATNAAKNGALAVPAGTRR